MRAIFLCIITTSIAVLPFFYIGEDPKKGCCGGAMPVTHDGPMHFNQMEAFERGLEAGKAYPRWHDETHFGYGAPVTSFYPPGIYYLTSALRVSLRNWNLVLIISSWLVFAASGAAIYRYASRAMSKSASSIVMVAYIIAPYHLINHYQRGAIAEQLSFIWVPMILIYAEKLLGAAGRERFRGFLGVSAFFGLFLWTHPPTAYQFLLIFGPCLAIRAMLERKWPEIALACGALIFGSMLAAAYFYPAIIEQKLINSFDIDESWPYHASYVYDFVQQINQHSGEGFIPRIDRIWALNAALLTVLGIAAAFLKRDARSWLWISSGGLAIFFMTRFSYPIGRLIPKIEIGVFSWRLLSLASLSVALLAGMIWQNRSAFIKSASILILALIALASYWLVAKPMYRAQAFEPLPEHFNYATLPRGAPRDLPPMEMAMTGRGDGSVEIVLSQPEKRLVRVNLPAGDRVIFRISDFPGWAATVDGRQVPHKTGELGNIELEVAQGFHEIALEFRPTPARRASAWISIISAGLFVILLIVHLGAVDETIRKAI